MEERSEEGVGEVPAALDLHKCILALYFLTFQYFDVILSTATSAWVTRDG